MNYTGYLRAHVETIRALHGEGKTPREIATVLYADGARSGTEFDQIAGIAQMAAYVLWRLGETPHAVIDYSPAVPEAVIGKRQAGLRIKDIAAEVGISGERTRRILIEAERGRCYPRWTDRLPSVRLRNALANVFAPDCKLADLAEVDVARGAALLGTDRWMALPNFGARSLAQLRAWLATHDLTLDGGV
jgi:hypothetical protein